MNHLDTHEQNCRLIAAAVLNGELDVSDQMRLKTCPGCGVKHWPTHGEVRCPACESARRRGKKHEH